MFDLIPEPYRLLATILGPLLIGVVIYFKGYRAGTSQQKSLYEAAKEKLDQELRGAEANNQKEDWHRDEEIRKVEKSGTRQDLLDLWNKRWGSGKSREDGRDTHD